MHPSEDKLRQFVERRNEQPPSPEIESHLAECEFCREFCDNYRLYLTFLEKAPDEVIPKRAQLLANDIFAAALSGRIIDLLPLGSDIPRSFLLAADSPDLSRPEITNLGTFCSEEPELVLRLMRDNQKGYDYLQLIGDRTDMISQVLIRIPELDREIVTDSGGRAAFPGFIAQSPETLKWQIKLPEASFTLKPLQYDPEAVEYQKEIILETARQDRIKIAFQKKTGGRQINISILKLDGAEVLAPLKVLMSQKENADLKNINPGESVVFDLPDSESEIKIRLFQ